MNTLCYDWLKRGQCLKRPRSNIQQQLVAAARMLHMLLCDGGPRVTAGRRFNVRGAVAKRKTGY